MIEIKFKKILVYKNHYVLIKKLHVLLKQHDSECACRWCLSCYSSSNVLIKHQQRCQKEEITAMKSSNESHLSWQKTFS